MNLKHRYYLLIFLLPFHLITSSNIDSIIPFNEVKRILESYNNWDFGELKNQNTTHYSLDIAKYGIRYYMDNNHKYFLKIGVVIPNRCSADFESGYIENINVNFLPIYKGSRIWHNSKSYDEYVELDNIGEFGEILAYIDNKNTCVNFIIEAEDIIKGNIEITGCDSKIRTYDIKKILLLIYDESEKKTLYSKFYYNEKF